MSTRSNYMKCCLLGLYKEGTTELIQITWCGRDQIQMDLVFQDPTHALLNARNQGSLMLCPECKKAMIKTLQEEGKWL